MIYAFANCLKSRAYFSQVKHVGDKVKDLLEMTEDGKVYLIVQLSFIKTS